MFNDNSYRKPPSICNFVPGYAFYSHIGNGLAETFVNLIELLIALLSGRRQAD